MEDTLQDALKAQNILVPRTEAIEQLRIMSHKMVTYASSFPAPASIGLGRLCPKITYYAFEHCPLKLPIMPHIFPITLQLRSSVHANISHHRYYLSLSILVYLPVINNKHTSVLSDRQELMGW